MKRHTCIICGKKRYEHNMENVFNSSWACTKNDSHFIFKCCCDSEEIYLAKKIIEDLKKLKKIKVKCLFGVVTPEQTLTRGKKDKK